MHSFLGVGQEQSYEILFEYSEKRHSPCESSPEGPTPMGAGGGVDPGGRNIFRNKLPVYVLCNIHNMKLTEIDKKPEESLFL